jgi:hypothetical protein
LKAVEKWGMVEGKGIRDSNEKGWPDQSNVYPQWAYNWDTPLRMNLNINNEKTGLKSRCSVWKKLVGGEGGW